MPVTNLAELDALVARVKAAQEEFATFSQEKVDAIFRAASLAANHARIPLAQQRSSGCARRLPNAHSTERNAVICLYRSSHKFKSHR